MIIFFTRLPKKDSPYIYKPPFRGKTLPGVESIFIHIDEKAMISRKGGKRKSAKRWHATARRRNDGKKARKGFPCLVSRRGGKKARKENRRELRL
jgi:hypothetical protein